MSRISDTPSETLVVAASTTISQELLEQLPDAAIALNQDWYIVNLNWRAEQLLCRQPEELIGQRFDSCFPAFVDALPEDREAILPGSLRPAAHFELFYEPTGIHLEVRACAYSAGWLIYLRDITLQKQAELALSEQTRLEGLSTTISQILQQGGELPDVLEHCAEGILQWLEDVSLVRIWHWNGESNLLELQAIAGTVVDANDLPQRISLGISIIGLIAQNRQPYLTNAAQQDICLGAKPWLQAHHISAFGGYPLIVEERLVGVLAIHSRHSISQTTHSWLQWITSAMAIAIDRSVARAALLSHRESFLLRLANHIRNSLDLDKILETAVEEVHNLLRLDYCQFLWCWASPGAAGSEVQPTLCITHESKQPEYPSLLGECSPSQIPTLANKVLNQQAIRIADSLQVDESELQTLMAGWGMRSLLLLPLETRAGHLGALICGRCEEARFWSDAEVELLQAVTDQLAIAIDQAELYAQTRAAAFAAQTQAQQLSEVLKNLRQTQAQLIQSEKMSSLGQLVAGIAHEINNPVTFISGNLSHASGYFQDLLSLVKLYQQHYPEPVAEIQSHIEEIDLEFMLSDLGSVLNSMKIGADRIYKIVLSLRNFSRLDEADVKAVDLHEGIDSTLLILQNRLKSNGSHSAISVVKQYGELPLVSCYASQLNQVFMNILSNAIDALQDSEPPYTITIRTEQRQEAIAPDQICTWAVIKIADNGIGMTEELRQKVFDPFFTTKPVGSGTGLGLSISHQIVVEKHKGRIECRSTPGEGTEFIIEIPVQNESDAVPAVALEVR